MFRFRRLLERRRACRQWGYAHSGKFTRQIGIEMPGFLIRPAPLGKPLDPHDNNPVMVGKTQHRPGPYQRRSPVDHPAVDPQSPTFAQALRR